MNKIVGIGNALVDVLVRLEDEKLLSELHLPKGGMQLIGEEGTKAVERKLMGRTTQKSTGGSAGNAVLALANLGAQPGFVGKVADDEMGRFFVDNCKATGIDARLIKGNGHSGVANTFITPDGERTFATALGVASTMAAEDIRSELFLGYQLIHVEGYLVQNHDLMDAICQTAKQMGMKVSLDLASYNVVSADLAYMRSLVQNYVDIVFANEEESAAFTSGKEPAEALEEIASMCEIAVVKLGSKGSSAMRGSEKAVVGAQKVDVVDTTAAGDFFAGGFLYALTQGRSLEDCLRTGALLSEHVIQVVGTRLSEEAWKGIRLEIEK